MWFGTLMCALSELSCLFLIFLDRRAEKLGALEVCEMEPEEISLKAVKEFPGMYWLINFIVVAFYSAVRTIFSPAQTYF